MAAETRVATDTVEQFEKIIQEYVASAHFPYTTNICVRAILVAVPRAERIEGSVLDIETNAKAESGVMISISTRVSLQWFKLNRKKSATKTKHNKSTRNVEQVFITKSFTVALEVKAKVVIVSQPDENRSKVDGIRLEPVHNGKISMRSPSSNAKRYSHNKYTKKTAM